MKQTCSKATARKKIFLTESMRKNRHRFETLSLWFNERILISSNAQKANDKRLRHRDENEHFQEHDLCLKTMARHDKRMHVAEQTFLKEDSLERVMREYTRVWFAATTEDALDTVASETTIDCSTGPTPTKS